eukprot:3800770-Pyramimonas_sp.AAC.1
MDAAGVPGTCTRLCRRTANESAGKDDPLAAGTGTRRPWTSPPARWSPRSWGTRTAYTSGDGKRDAEQEEVTEDQNTMGEITEGGQEKDDTVTERERRAKMEHSIPVGSLRHASYSTCT